MRHIPLRFRLASCAILVAALSAGSAMAQKISEVVAAHAGPDDHEYIEIWGNPSAPYSTYRILELDGGGVILRALQPGTTNGGGFWTTGYLTTTLEQPVFTLLLVSGFSGSVGNDLDGNNDGTLDSTPWSALADSVAFTDGSSGRTYSTTVLGPGFDGNAAIPYGASRFPYFKDTDSASDWKRNDFDGEGLPGFTGTLVPGEARNTPNWPTTVTLTDYYAGVNATNATTLRTTLHALIRDHIRYPYTSSTTDTWDILESADQHPTLSNYVLDLYKNASYLKFGGGTGPYNREHSWPNSYGFSVNTTIPYTDCHHLFLTEVSYNSARGNKPFVTCDASCQRYATDPNEGYGGVNGPYPSDSNWKQDPDGKTGKFEVWSHRQGDIARAQFYMDVRYAGGTHSVYGVSEPELILTDNLSLLNDSDNSPAYMGKLSTLISWSAADVPDDYERRRNDIVASYQGNRNPFIDHPEWVACLFLGGPCGGGCSATATVTGSATICAGGSTQIQAALTGTAPWNIMWSDGVPQNGITSSPATRTVSPASSITYTVTSVTDATCTGTSSGSAAVTVASKPTAQVSGSQTVCSGTPATISASLTGTAPWSVTWSDGVTQPNVSTSPATRNVTPASTTTYTVTAVSDAACSGTSMTGSATVTVVARPTATVTGSTTICPGGSTQIQAALTGNAPWTVAWSDGFTQPGLTSSPATRTVSPASTTAYSVTTVSDASCSAPGTGTATITVGAPSTAASLEWPPNGTTGYQGSHVSWTHSGTGPYDVYFDTVSPPQKLHVRTSEKKARLPVWFPSTGYSWKIVVQGACGTPTSPTGTFQTGTCSWTGSAPTLVSPTNGATGVQTTQLLTWLPVPGAAHYEVDFGTTNPPLQKYRTVNPYDSSLSVKLNPGTTYYWRVVAYPICGSAGGAASNTGSFTTGGASMALMAFQPVFLNRWQSPASVSGSGAGFTQSSALFLEGAAGRAATFASSAITSTLISGSFSFAGTEPADIYDAGVEASGLETARLVRAVALRAFTDVVETDYYFESSSRVVDAGIMEADADPGTSGPQFLPSAEVTRVQMAVYLAGAYQWWRTRSTALEPATCTAPDFKDVPCSHPNWLAIHWIKTWGVTVGAPCLDGDGLCYLPDRVLNRAEMMTFLERLKQGAILPGLLSGLGETDPGCSQPYPACAGWTDPGMQVAGWPRREFNVAFADRVTVGCGGPPGNGLTACVYDPLTRAQIATLLARQMGLVPSP